MIELIRGLDNIQARHQGCVVTIGNFDGVHIGHQALLHKTKERAANLGVHSCVVTFEPHPMEFFLKEKVAPRLMRLREKTLELSAQGMDQVLVIPFNADFVALTPEAFVQSILVEKLRVKHVVIGDDFHFGKERQGDIAFLQASGQHYGFTVDAIPGVKLTGQRVSSSRVREALAAADHELVARLLGRPYTMMGRVAHGDKRGRIIGFPTANIYLHRAMTPVQGVYAVRTYGIAPEGLPGVANVGMRPTVGGTRSLLEVHLFNFNQDIYGRHVCVEFCAKFRDEQRFDSLELLKQQIFKDAEWAKDFFERSQ